MTGANILIKGGRVVDPANQFDFKSDVRISDGRVDLVSEEITPNFDEIIVDAAGQLVIPGLVDTHVHLCEPFGGPHGYRMLARAGVTCALDMAGDPASIIQGLKSDGTGITVGFVFPLIPGLTTSGRDPKKDELAQICANMLDKGALGLKILGGHYPMSPEATAMTIMTAADARCWCAIHAGTLNTGSDISGLEEIVELADGLPVHLAHINSYCRGQHTGYPLEEASRAITALSRAQNIRSESYLAPINGADATQVDGVPKSDVVKTCLKLGNFPATSDGMETAIRSGWAKIHGMWESETVLLPPDAGLKHYITQRTNVGVSFPVNPPGSAISIALAKNGGEFVVTALSTDGGSIPRNTTIEQGLALVEFGALTLGEFVHKACFAPAKMFGLPNKGHFSPGADGDVAIVDPLARRATWVFANGQVVMRSGVVVGRGGRIATTARGVSFLETVGIESTKVSANWY